jgi:hypothetical protein
VSSWTNGADVAVSTLEPCNKHKSSQVERSAAELAAMVRVMRTTLKHWH